MKAVILAGGLGTRLAEETVVKPKPMVEIGGIPILVHIMQFYASYGVREFIICGGYKQEVIKQYFFNQRVNSSDVTFDMQTGDVAFHASRSKNWKVTVVDTGQNTMTGGRIKRIRQYVGDAPFFMTYGDGLCDVDLNKLYEYHKSKNGLVTVSAVETPFRFGALDIQDGKIERFMEKKAVAQKRINGGYMVIDPIFLDYIEGDHSSLEEEPLQKAAAKGQLYAYEHNGFWQCMDNIREKEMLEALWQTGAAPWVVPKKDSVQDAA